MSDVPDNLLRHKINSDRRHEFEPSPDGFAEYVDQLPAQLQKQRYRGFDGRMQSLIDDERFRDPRLHSSLSLLGFSDVRPMKSGFTGYTSTLSEEIDRGLVDDINYLDKLGLKATRVYPALLYMSGSFKVYSRFRGTFIDMANEEIRNIDEYQRRVPLELILRSLEARRRHTKYHTDENNISSAKAKLLPSRLVELLDVEGMTCDLKAVAIREKWLDRLTKTPLRTQLHKSEHTKDLIPDSYSLVLSETDTDRRSALLATIGTDLEIRIWTDKNKKGVFRSGFSRDDLKAGPIYLGLTLRGIDNGWIFLPLIKSVRAGKEGMCHIILADRTESDDRNYNNNSLNKLLENGLNETNWAAALTEIVGIMRQNPDSIQVQMYLEHVIRNRQKAANLKSDLLDAITGSHDNNLATIDVLPISSSYETTVRSMRIMGNAESVKMKLFGNGLTIDALSPINQDIIQERHELSLDGAYKDKETGIAFFKMTLYKGLAEKYGIERSQMRPWFELRLSEIGGVQVYAYDYEHAACSFRELNEEDRQLLRLVLENVLKPIKK